MIALAVAGVVAAPAAFAETKISGSISVMANSYDKNGAATSDTTHIEDGNTFINIKGSEDLGGGMSAFYSMDFGVDVSGHGAAAGAGQEDINGQNMIVGLGGSFGKVIAGSFDNPTKVMAGGYELFGNQPGDRRALLSVGYTDARSDNVVAYLTPDFNGFSGAIAHFNPNVSETDASGDDSTVVVKVQYANGPFSAGVAHYKSEQGADDEKAIRVALGYKMGDTKLNALWQDVDNVAGTATADSKGYLLGVAHTMGPITLKAQYTSLDSATANADASMTAVGVDYALSKGTKVFAHYAKIDNQSAATQTIRGWTGADAAADAVTAGNDPSVFGVGIRHNF